MGKCRSIAMFMSQDASITKMNNNIKYRYDSVFVFFVGDCFNKFRLVWNGRNLTSRLLEQHITIDNTSPKSRVKNWMMSLKFSPIRIRFGLIGVAQGTQALQAVYEEVYWLHWEMKNTLHDRQIASGNMNFMLQISSFDWISRSVLHPEQEKKSW